MKQMGEREVRTVSTYVITGGTTGIGAAVRKTLLDQGHEVFNIDYKGGDCPRRRDAKVPSRRSLRSIPTESMF